MLEHQKWVIQNVANDRELFIKEIHKSLAWLEKEEIEEFTQWLRTNYGDTLSDEISLTWGVYTDRKGNVFYKQKIDK
ncbi:MAG: hypothetical protein ACOCXV_02150 [Bacteroidota bacterium]